MQEVTQRAEEVKEETTEKTHKAKWVSLISKIVGILILVIGFGLKIFKVCPDLDIDDLIKVSLAVVGMCGTIDINLMIDKFVKKE